MFLEFYGLREQPFGVTPNPRYLYHSAVHREALASLIYGIEADLGFAALIAEPGMGKTTLLFYLLEKFRNTARTALIFQTLCTPLELLRYLANELEIHTNDSDPVSLNERIKDVLVQEARARRRVIVIIDEAQNLDESVLETVRLLSDFETQSSKLLHIILAGQLQLAEKLARPNMAQLLQRIAMLNRLKPFTTEETKNYIEYRLGVAGYLGTPLFPPDAIETVAALSGGTPRKINRICFNALSLGCALGARAITGDIIKEVGTDLDLGDLLYRKGAITDNPAGAVTEPSAAQSKTDESPASPARVPNDSVPRVSPVREAERLPWDVAPPDSGSLHAVSTVSVAAAPVAARVDFARSSSEPVRPAQMSVASNKPLSQPLTAATAPNLPPSTEVRSAPSGPVIVKSVPVQHNARSTKSRTLAWILSGVAVAVLGVAGWTLWSGNLAQVRASVEAAPQTRPAGQEVNYTLQETPPPAQQPVPVNPSRSVAQDGTKHTQPKRLENKFAPAARAATVPSPAPARAASAPAVDDQPASPALIRKVQPIYPVVARRSGIQGSVTVAALIGTDGRPRYVRAVTGDPILARAATDAVSQWIYEPYVVNGRPVEVETEVVVDFALR